MAADQFMGPFSKSTYQKRRSDLAKRLSRDDSDFLALVWSGSEQRRNRYNSYAFRAASNFLYLTGFSEPEAMLLIRRSKGKLKTTLCLRPRDLSPHRGSEIWEGERLGVERAMKTLGVDEAVDIHKLDECLSDQLSGVSTVFWDLGEYPEWDQKIAERIKLISYGRNKGKYPHRVIALSASLGEMRKKKSSEELEVMRHSAEIAAQGHIRAMQIIRPGMFEYEIQAETEKEFRKRGAFEPAYTSICATGANACTLHYHSNRQRIEKGDVFLMDAGAEYQGYASDITRSFPATGEFSKAQAEAYSWVLEAQKEAIRAVKPGVAWSKPHDTAVEVLSEGLRALKVLKESKKTILEKSLWRRYMPHGTSHWIGMDVHDVGAYDDENATALRLEIGNVLTIEPGLYFPKADKKVPSSLRGLGIRIEDDVAVSKKGADVLSSSCPKEIEELRALRAPRF